VALPMDEQRILDEMERMLAADDPRLAARLAAFGQPGFGHVLRTRRARATMSVMVLVLIAAVAAVIYMMSAFRPSGVPSRHPGQSTVSSPPGRSGTQPVGQHLTVSARAAQLGQSSQPATYGKFCAATFCGPAFTPAVDRFLARASRQASRP
jgi:Protein of unknown function (DUF3040)